MYFIAKLFIFVTETNPNGDSKKNEKSEDICTYKLLNATSSL